VEQHNIQIGDPDRSKGTPQIIQTGNNKIVIGDHLHLTTDSSPPRQMIDNHVALITTETSHIIGLPGNLRTDKIINKEIRDQPARTEITNNKITDRLAHTDKPINQIDSPVHIEIMIIETDQIAQIEIRIDQITNITGRHLHITTKTTETTPPTTASNRTSNIEETIDEEAIHHYHLQLNQEPTVDQTTEEP